MLFVGSFEEAEARGMNRAAVHEITFILVL